MRAACRCNWHVGREDGRLCFHESGQSCFVVDGEGARGQRPARPRTRTRRSCSELLGCAGGARGREGARGRKGNVVPVKRRGHGGRRRSAAGRGRSGRPVKSLSVRSVVRAAVLLDDAAGRRYWAGSIRDQCGASRARGGSRCRCWRSCSSRGGSPVESVAARHDGGAGGHRSGRDSTDCLQVCRAVARTGAFDLHIPAGAHFGAERRGGRSSWGVRGGGVIGRDRDELEAQTRCDVGHQACPTAASACCAAQARLRNAASLSALRLSAQRRVA